MGGNGWLLGVHDAEEVATPDFGDVFLGVAHFQQSHGDVDHVVVAIEARCRRSYRRNLFAKYRSC